MTSLSGGGAGTVFPASLLFKGDAAKKTINTIVNWWSKKYPRELRDYKREVRYIRENLRGKGMAVSGDYMAHSVVPTRINIIMEHMVPGFWNNGGRDLWVSEFPAFRIK